MWARCISDIVVASHYGIGHPGLCPAPPAIGSTCGETKKDMEMPPNPLRVLGHYGQPTERRCGSYSILPPPGVVFCRSLPNHSLPRISSSRALWLISKVTPSALSSEGHPVRSVVPFVRTEKTIRFVVDRVGRVAIRLQSTAQIVDPLVMQVGEQDVRVAADHSCSPSARTRNVQISDRAASHASKRRAPRQFGVFRGRSRIGRCSSRDSMCSWFIEPWVLVAPAPTKPIIEPSGSHRANVR